MWYASTALCASSATTQSPLLVVTLMVKNESDVMASTLQPFVDAGINSYFILDTGSTDATIAVTEQFFKDNNIQHGVIEQQPFVDFATSRNVALRRAEYNFPNAAFLLMLDAEWHMHNVKGLLQFCADHVTEVHECYVLRILNPDLDFYTQRLIRAHCGVKFVGVVHEVPERGSSARVPPDIYFELRTTRYGREKSKTRWLRDRDLLLKEHERNPNDPRTLFYLAQTCDCLGDLENARIYYTKRIATPGWDEENFVAFHRLGQVYEKLNDWEKALPYYLKAFAIRPKRAESLIKIASYYTKQQQFDLGCLFAQYAAGIEYPKNDFLFVEKYLYDYVRYDALGICAWHTGKYAEGKKATQQALQVCPEAPHLHRNLATYLEREQAMAAA